MRGNVKRLSGPPHPDRERQFQYIQQQRQIFVESGCPILSVDAKKKELIGNFKNLGRRWVRQPDEVNTHDFPQDALCKATPYTSYPQVSCFFLRILCRVQLSECSVTGCQEGGHHRGARLGQ